MAAFAHHPSWARAATSGRVGAQARPASTPSAPIRGWIARWWHNLPEIDKAILSGAAWMSLLFLAAMLWLFVGAL
jgi:hypothetical protein